MSEASRARGRFPVTARVRGETPVDLSALGGGSVEERILAIEQALRLVAGRDSQEKRLNELSAALNSIAPIATERKVWGAKLASDTIVSSTSFVTLIEMKLQARVPARLIAEAVCSLDTIAPAGDLIVRLLWEQSDLGLSVALTNALLRNAAGQESSVELLSPGFYTLEPGYEYTLALEARTTTAGASYQFLIGGTTRATVMMARLEPRQKSET